MNVYFNPANALGTAMYFDQASLNVVQNSPFGVITAFGGGVQARVPDIVPSYLYNTPQISPIFNFGGGFDFSAMFSQMMQWFSGMFSSGGKDYSNLTPAQQIAARLCDAVCETNTHSGAEETTNEDFYTELNKINKDNILDVIKGWTTIHKNETDNGYKMKDFIEFVTHNTEDDKKTNVFDALKTKLETAITVIGEDAEKAADKKILKNALDALGDAIATNNSRIAQTTASET